MKSAEQQARDLLEKYGLEDAQSLSAGDVLELANLIVDANAYRQIGVALSYIGEIIGEPHERR